MLGQWNSHIVMPVLPMFAHVKSTYQNHQQHSTHKLTEAADNIPICKNWKPKITHSNSDHNDTVTYQFKILVDPRYINRLEPYDLLYCKGIFRAFQSVLTESFFMVYGNLARLINASEHTTLRLLTLIKICSFQKAPLHIYMKGRKKYRPQRDHILQCFCSDVVTFGEQSEQQETA